MPEVIPFNQECSLITPGIFHAGIATGLLELIYRRVAVSLAYYRCGH